MLKTSPPRHGGNADLRNPVPITIHGLSMASSSPRLEAPPSMRTPSLTSSQTRVLVLSAAAIAVIVGCTEAGRATAPLASLRRATPSNPFARVGRIPFPDVGRNECVLALVGRDDDGVPERWSVQLRRGKMNDRAGGPDEEWQVYGMFQFDGNGRQTLEARCLLKTSAEAKDIARGFFALSGEGTERAALIGAGTACYKELDGFGEWTGGIVCGGETCSPTNMAMRALRHASGGPSGSAIIENVIAAWTCSGGGTIVILSSGFAGYVPPNGSEPANPVVPPCPGTGGGYNPPNDSILDELRWGSLLCADSIPYFCKPKWVSGGYDTTCYVPLSGSRRARLDSVLANMLKPADSIADTAARRVCRQAKAKALQLLGSDSVFAGAYDDSSHYAEWQGILQNGSWTGFIHLDPAVLDSAESNNNEAVSHYKGDMLVFLLHEVLHPLNHPSSHVGGPPYTAADGPWQYMNTYFASVPRSPCINW